MPSSNAVRSISSRMTAKKRLSSHGETDLDLGKAALQPPVVIGEENRFPPTELEHFIKCVAKLEAAILNAEHALGSRRESAVEVEDVVHWFFGNETDHHRDTEVTENESCL